MALEDFHEFTHGTGDEPLRVFRSGEGPGIIILHELPGMTQACVQFARRVRDAGFAVYLPLFFGEPDQEFGLMNTLRHSAQVCMSREFAVFAARGTSPVVEKLRDLCRRVHRERGGPGVGAVGMCLTGGFAIPMMVEPSMLAPVVSQPGLPMGMGATARCALGISPRDMRDARERAETENLSVRGYRFSHDLISPPEKFETLEREFKNAFIPFVIDSSPGNEHGIPRTAHSVFTQDYDHRVGHPTRQAFDDLLAFLRERLSARSL